MGIPKNETQLPPLDISKGLWELFNEVVSGTAHLNAAKSLAEAAKSHPVIMRVSPKFFTLTTEAHLEAAQLAAAKLFDKHNDCAGIPWLLSQAENRPKEFASKTGIELNEAIIYAEQTCAEKATVLDALKHRRDRWLAHLDKRTVRNPAQFAIDADLKYADLENLFASALEILNTMACLHGDAGFIVFDDDFDDLSHTLDLITKGVQANAHELEQRIGPCPDEPGGSF
jgi:hypothetical protein